MKRATSQRAPIVAAETVYNGANTNNGPDDRVNDQPGPIERNLIGGLPDVKDSTEIPAARLGGGA